MQDNPSDLNAMMDGATRPSLVGRALAAGERSGRRLGRAITPRMAPIRALQPLAARSGLRISLSPAGFAGLIPALILASGIVTAVGAQLLGDADRRAVAALAPRTAPLIAAERADRAQAESLAELRPLLEGGTVSARIETLARGLPAEARIAALGRDSAGRTSLSLLAADPDRLRGNPALAGFRLLDQRRDPSGRMLIVYQAGGR